MRLRELLTDDDAVSPVIGVILMVAITVILAAVIASFVLGLGDSQDVAPNTNFQYDYNGNDTLTVSVSGGDSVDANQLTFAGNDALGDYAGLSWADANNTADDARLGAGDRVQIGPSEAVGDGNDFFDGGAGVDQNVGTDYEISIVWTSEDGDTSSTLSQNSGPDA